MYLLLKNHQKNITHALNASSNLSLPGTECTVFGFLSRDFTLREITLHSGIKISQSLFLAYWGPGTSRYPIYPDAGDVCDAASVLCAYNVAGNTDI